MSYSSSSTSSVMSTPSPRSHPVQIQSSASGSPRSVTSTSTQMSQFAFLNTTPRRASITTFNSANQNRKLSTERPSAYISDADLWGVDDSAGGATLLPYLKAAPAPPRSAEQWLTQPLPAPQPAPGSWMAQRRANGAARKASAQIKKR